MLNPLAELRDAARILLPPAIVGREALPPPPTGRRRCEVPSYYRLWYGRQPCGFLTVPGLTTCYRHCADAFATEAAPMWVLDESDYAQPDGGPHFRRRRWDS